MWASGAFFSAQKESTAHAAVSTVQMRTVVLSVRKMSRMVDKLKNCHAFIQLLLPGIVYINTNPKPCSSINCKELKGTARKTMDRDDARNHLWTYTGSWFRISFHYEPHHQQHRLMLALHLPEGVQLEMPLYNLVNIMWTLCCLVVD